MSKYQADAHAAIAHVVNKISTHSRRHLDPTKYGGSAAARQHWSWLRLRMQTVAALGGFQKATNEMRQQILLSAARRMNGYVKRRLGDGGLEALFATLDRDGSGSLDVSEFRAGLTRTIGLNFDNQTISVLMAYIDTDGSGDLNVEEFCNKMLALQESEDSSGRVILSRLCKHLASSGTTVDAFVAELDGDATDTLDAVEFQKALDRIGVANVTQESVARAMAELDVDGDGSLGTSELATCLSEFERKRRVFASSVLGEVVDFVNRANTSLVNLFSRVDSDGSGALDVLELQEALRKLHQDLSEAEVDELMQELGLGQNVSCAKFLDKLKLFQSERIADTETCTQFFGEFDMDKSGYLERSEVSKLACRIGFQDKIDTDSTFVDTLLSEIKSARFNASYLIPKTDEDQEKAKEQEDMVTLNELLPWFLHTGRSYLPRRVYPEQPDLENPTPEQLKALFAKLDQDSSGDITAQEARVAIATMWPLLEEKTTQIAFDIADRHNTGKIGLDGVLILLRCLLYLNKKRHPVDEILTRFEGEAVIGEDEFHLGCKVIGVQLLEGATEEETDAAIANEFESYCAKLATNGQLRPNCRMSGPQFVSWVVQHECVDPELAAWASEEVKLSRVRTIISARSRKHTHAHALTHAITVPTKNT